MLTIELSSHSHLLTACGNTSHNGPAAKSTTGPQSLFSRDDRPTVTFRPCTVLRNKHSRVRPGSNPPGCSEIGFVSKLQIHRPAFIRGLCTMCTIPPKSPIGFVFSTPGRPVLCAQVCTNMHKSLQSPRESYPANSNNSQPVIKNWLRSAKTVRPTSGKHFGPFELFIGSTAGDRALFCRPV